MSASKWELSFRAMTLGKFHIHGHEVYLNPSQKHPRNPVSHSVSICLPLSPSLPHVRTDRNTEWKISYCLLNNFILFAVFYMCMYVYMHVTYYWFVYVGARDQHGVCSSNGFHSFRSSKQGVLMSLVLADLVKIPSQSVPGILSPPPSHWDCPLGFFLCNCWRSKLQSSCLHVKYFMYWAISQAQFYFLG